MKFALLAAPLIAACGGGVNSGGVVIPAGGLTFPDCNDGELIGVGADKTLACLPSPSSKLSPPSCLADQVLTSEEGALKCATKGNGTVDMTVLARITNVESQINSINNTVMSLKGGGGGRAKWVGTTGNTNGEFVSGQLRGINAAAKICRDAFTNAPNAHMCTTLEMYEVAATGQITDQTVINKAWIYMIGWNNPDASRGTVEEPLNGLGENCAGYTYKTNDKHWVGTAVTWGTTSLGGRALKFFSGFADAACSQLHPIACCE